MRTKPLICLPAALFLAVAGCAPARQAEFADHPPSLHVARTALDTGAPGIALSVADANLAVDPGNVDAIVTRGDAFAALGQPDAASLAYRRALAIDPGSPGAALGCARLVLASNPAQAVALLTPLVVRDQASAAAYNDLGIARDLLGLHREAQKNYQEALAADPEMKAALDNLARSVALSRRQAP